MRLVLASRNPNKLVELRALCGLPADFLVSAAECPGAPDPDEDANTFVGNALIKARALRDFSGEWALADDSGLEVDALGGAPGIYSARYASDHNFASNIDRLLAELNGVEDRSGRFRCVVTLILPDGKPHFFDGACEGRIARERHGSGGFGYDPVFVPDLYPNLTMAELSEDAKNAISHRGVALRLMATYLATK